MRFKALLIHRCTLNVQGEKIGEDDYGRDIIGSIEHMNVPCRVDQIRQRAANDDTGRDFIFSNVLFLAADQEINLNTSIHDIRDKEGNLVLQGSFSVLDIMPIYDRLKLHHYEITLQRS